MNPSVATNGQAGAATSLALYDLIMQNIEPELCSDQLVLLEERYSGETPEEHEERMQRYERAYFTFDEAVKLLDDDVSFVAEEMRVAAQAKQSHISAADDRSTVTRLEHDIDTTAS